MAWLFARAQPWPFSFTALPAPSRPQGIMIDYDKDPRHKRNRAFTGQTERGAFTRGLDHEVLPVFVRKERVCKAGALPFLRRTSWRVFSSQQRPCAPSVHPNAFSSLPWRARRARCSAATCSQLALRCTPRAGGPAAAPSAASAAPAALVSCPRAPLRRRPWTRRCSSSTASRPNTPPRRASR